MLTALPLPQDSAAPWEEMFPEPPVPPVEKRTQRRTNCPPHPRMVDHSVATPTLISYHWIAGLSHCKYNCDREWGGACNNQPMDVGRPSSYWQCPNSNLNQGLCSSVEPSWEHTLTREPRGVQICLIHILKQEVCQPYSPVFSHPGRVLSHSPANCGDCLQPHLTRRARDDSRKLRDRVTLELKEEQTEVIVCRANGLIWPGNLWCGSAWVKATKSCTGFRAAPLLASRQGI